MSQKKKKKKMVCFHKIINFTTHLTHFIKDSIGVRNIFIRIFVLISYLW